ncbi:MAG: hypothetical protein H7Z16_09195 [Pyrinomonadaceae bacterium]|nr:hypothetical protein [Pyrinomonadaceae bacterium]
MANEFIKRLQSLERTRVKAEALYVEGHFGKRDVAHVYEAIFLSLMTRFESLLEELFFALLMGRMTSTNPKMRSKISARSEVVIRKILLSGDDYLTWLPYRRTEDRAGYYFASGIPFSSLDDGERSFLRESLFIRNAVAHKSKFALKQFHKKVNGVSRLPPRERTPAGFLRSEFRNAPAQCRYENLAAKLGGIANKLCR